MLNKVSGGVIKSKTYPPPKDPTGKTANPDYPPVGHQTDHGAATFHRLPPSKPVASRNTSGAKPKPVTTKRLGP